MHGDRGGGRHAMTHMWSSEDNCKGHVFFHPCGLLDRTEIIRIGDRPFTHRAISQALLYFIAVTNHIIMSCVLIWTGLQFLCVSLNCVENLQILNSTMLIFIFVYFQLSELTSLHCNLIPSEACLWSPGSRLQADKILSLCLSGNVFITFSFLKESFVG